MRSSPRTFVLAVALALSGLPYLAASRPEPAGGVDLAGIDRGIAPGDDFFLYGNGAWVAATEIPADRGAFGASAIVSERTDRRIQELVQELGATAPLPGSEARKVADYYASFLDEAAIDARGLAPLQPTLDRIAAIADRRALARFLGAALRADVDAFNATDLYTPHLFGLWVAQDLNQPTRYAAFLMQGGLDLPDRAYYLDPAPRMSAIRDQHRAHIAAVLTLAGLADAEVRAGRVFELERAIAQAHVSREDSHGADKGNNPWPRARFDSAAPGLDWTEYFAAAGLGAQQEFVAWQPSAVTGLSALVASQPLETWKDYLRFHALEERAEVLPQGFRDQRFALHSTALSGVPKPRERWQRAIDATSAALGEALGKLYVARHFPPASKARAEAMVANLRTAFGQRIDRLEWMTPATKAQAKAKLAVLRIGVGYPDHWRDYSELEVVRGDAFGNAERASLHELRRNLRKLGQSVDRGEWVMVPQRVNAVNLPAMNAINLPAAILQPPFFDATRPAALDYGAVGTTIGHEISHSFDDQGALFDADGRLRNWWTDADREHFQAAAARLVAQYDGYRPFPDLAVNGTLTLSENIADVAGISASYDAYRLSLGGEPAPVVQGLSGDQQFFLSFTQRWRSKSREAALRQQVLVDGHAPGRYRACVVRNLDAWYPAFDVKPGQALYLAPEARVRIW